MDKSECPICENPFDGERHRPRTFPCGHGCCKQCIEICIRTGNKTCPVCRKAHRSNSATELAVNFLLEELLHKSAMSASQKNESGSVHEEDSVRMCPKHKGVPLYFHCKSHDVKVCHSCAVIDHPPTSCKLISLDEEVKEKKQSKLLTVQEQKQVLIDTKKDLKILLQRNIDSLTERKNKKEDLEKEIEQINQEILKKDKSHKQIKEAIQSCQKKQKSFEKLENKLTAATSNQDITKQCEMATTEILQNQKWQETLSKDLNLKLNKDVYAQVIRSGTQRSCKIVTEGGRTYIPNLSKEVKPSIFSKLLHEAELGLTTSTTTVFMDLSAQGHSLGRVYVRVMGDRAHGQQFIMLALGTDGPTLKGATFYESGFDYISLKMYVTESGLGEYKPLLKGLKGNNSEKMLRGRLFPTKDIDTGSLRIQAKNTYATQHGYFGDVIEGMDIVDTAASSKYDITDITISKCGIILDY